MEKSRKKYGVVMKKATSVVASSVPSEIRRLRRSRNGQASATSGASSTSPAVYLKPIAAPAATPAPAAQRQVWRSCRRIAQNRASATGSSVPVSVTAMRE